MASVFLVLGLSVLSAMSMVSVSDFSLLQADRDTAEFIASVEAARIVAATPEYDLRGPFEGDDLLEDEGLTPGPAGDCPAGAGEWADAGRFDGLSPSMVCLKVERRQTSAGCSSLLEWHVRTPGRQLLRAPWGKAARSLRIPDAGGCSGG